MSLLFIHRSIYFLQGAYAKMNSLLGLIECLPSFARMKAICSGILTSIRILHSLIIYKNIAFFNNINYRLNDFMEFIFRICYKKRTGINIWILKDIILILKKKYEIRLEHFLNKLLINNKINKNKKWKKLEKILKARHNVDTSSRQLRYMFNEHKFYEDIINIREYAELAGMSLIEFKVFIENTPHNVNYNKKWQNDIIQSLNLLESHDLKTRQRLTTSIIRISNEYTNDLDFIANIIEIYLKYKDKKSNRDISKKINFSIQFFKMIFGK